MKPKTKRLKWVATEYGASGRYMVWSWSEGKNWNASAMLMGQWCALIMEVSKSRAFAACERHSREKGKSQ